MAMLPKHMEQRSDSLRLVVDDNLLDTVDMQKLYLSVLKILLVEYVSEARFYQPVVDPAARTKENARTADRRSRLSRADTDCAMPSHLFSDLKAKLHDIAMNLSRLHDDLTRRSLLRFYGEMLDPQFKHDVKRAGSIDVLLMKFVSTANKEMVKMGTIAPEDVSRKVFDQTGEFIRIVMLLVQRDKNKDALLAKLNEHQASLKPQSASPSSSSSSSSSSVKYVDPPYKLADMDQASIQLVETLFGKSRAQMQQDIDDSKGYVSQKTLHKDVDQILFYLEKDLGKFQPAHFVSREAYHLWKDRETAFCVQLQKKYKVPVSKRLLANPPLPAGLEFYIMPPTPALHAYYTTLVKLCLANHKTDAIDDTLILSNKSKDLLATCARFWRIDYSSRAVSLFAAAHLCGLLLDPLHTNDAKELGPINLQTSVLVLDACKKALEENGKMKWDEKYLWNSKDQETWVKYLGYTYSEVFHSLKDCLSVIMSKTVKPKFGPFLGFLGDYVESDALFPQVKATGVTSKWERKLTRTLLRTLEASYADVLSTLPRDDTLSIVHILDISDVLVGNIRSLQKKYKAPLLGFLNVSRTYAAVITGMFAADAKNILKHITSHAKAKNEFLNYGDALEAYKSLCEIRSIHQQVAPQTPFSFDLEAFFYPLLESWVAESGTKIREFVVKAVEEDTFEPIDIDDDNKKYSTSIHDIFTMIKNYLHIINSLNWQDRFQRAKVYTLLIKSISDSAILYATQMADMINKDLNMEVLEKKPETVAPNGGWFAEVKSRVASIQVNNDKVEIEQPYNFTPRTCVGLNNIEAMINQLEKLETLLNTEEVSLIVAKHDPKLRDAYTGHIVSLRIVKGENLRSPSDSSFARPYMTLIDTKARKTIAKTRSLDSENPQWDEEYEFTLAANASITLSATVWEERFTHSVCGRALMQLEPRKFKHDGIPQEICLDLDPQGRVHIEVAVESEKHDAIFAMGRAHRALTRILQRINKMIVAKFLKFIHLCFSRAALRSVCGSSGNVKPDQDKMDEAMLPLYNYLNMNLLVLAQHLTTALLHQVMLEAWNIVVASADELLLPKLTSSRLLAHHATLAKPTSGSGWQSAMHSAMANMTSSMNALGFGKTLTNNEIEVVISWLNFLCYDFFYNEGNGPPVQALKTDQYQSILLIPVYYDKPVDFLHQEVERLSPAFLQMLRDKNNVYLSNHPDGNAANLRSRAGSIARNLTIRANATANARAKAAKEAKELSSDPLVAQTAAENIILRLLLIKDEKPFVARRIEQRERLAHTIATERLARAAAEGNLFG